MYWLFAWKDCDYDASGAEGMFAYKGKFATIELAHSGVLSLNDREDNAQIVTVNDAGDLEETEIFSKEYIRIDEQGDVVYGWFYKKDGISIYELTDLGTIDVTATVVTNEPPQRADGGSEEE